ncbi:MAG: hypothetical protein WCI73_18105 [Phycisphaerae bacterium]
MTPRQRLMATLRGQPVDRPPVSFYEIGGFKVDPADPEPFNIYNDPSWAPLLELAETQTDLIRMRGPMAQYRHPELRAKWWRTETWQEGDSRFTRLTIQTARRQLTQLQRRDRQIDTIWTLEHLLKDLDDLRAFLEIPDETLDTTVDVSNLLEAERLLGDRGIVMVDTSDPLCQAAGLFSMEDFTLLAFTEPEAFHALLRKLARPLYAQTQATARAFPGRLWRI